VNSHAHIQTNPEVPMVVNSYRIFPFSSIIAHPPLLRQSASAQQIDISAVGAKRIQHEVSFQGNQPESVVFL
jgi:hypothetical protein